MEEGKAQKKGTCLPDAVLLVQTYVTNHGIYRFACELQDSHLDQLWVKHRKRIESFRTSKKFRKITSKTFFETENQNSKPET